MKQFDSHAHVFKVGLPLAKVRRYAPDYDAKVEEFLYHLDQHGFTHGILIQPSFLGTDNSYMMEAIKKADGRLYGVIVVDPDVDYDIMKTFAENNIIGIRLNLVGKPLVDFSKDGWPQMLEKVKKLGWHVEIHRSSDDMEKIIAPLLAAGVKVVIDHFGKPDPDNPLDDDGFKYMLKIGKTGRVWVKISAFYRIGGVEAGERAAKIMVPELLKAYGPERLLWGSDWPHTKNEDVMNYDLAYNTFLRICPEDRIREIVCDKAVNDLITIK